MPTSIKREPLSLYKIITYYPYYGEAGDITEAISGTTGCETFSIISQLKYYGISGPSHVLHEYLVPYVLQLLPSHCGYIYSGLSIPLLMSVLLILFTCTLILLSQPDPPLLPCISPLHILPFTHYMNLPLYRRRIT